MPGAAKLGWIEQLRAGQWMRADTVVRLARVLLVINLILAGWAVAALQRIEPGAQPVSSDFVSFYAAGTLALDGRPAGAYDVATHQQAEAEAAGPGRGYQFFFYPPPYLILCSALATLPYRVAFAVFEAATLSLFLLAMHRLCSQVSWRVWLWPVSAFTPLFWTIGLGQNAFLTAALLAGATLLADRRPTLAGVLFGALCLKPHFGLLVPVALVAGGRWRSVVAAGGTVAGLVIASWLLYGWSSWEAYLRAFIGSGETYGSGRIAFAGMVSPFGAARLAGAPIDVALVLQGVMTLAAAITVGWIWRCSHRQAVRSAALLAGTMVALPVILLYDQMTTLVALAWLACEVRLFGPLPWEKLVLAAAYLLPLIGFPFSLIWNLPLAPLPAAMLLALCAVHTWVARRRLNRGASIVRRVKGGGLSGPQDGLTTGSRLTLEPRAKATCSVRFGPQQHPLTPTRPMQGRAMIFMRCGLPLALAAGLAACGSQPRQATTVTEPHGLPGTPEESLVRMGDSMRQSGDFNGASDFYLAAIARDPYDAAPLLRLGDTQLVTGEFERAEQSFRATLALAAGNREASVGLAIALLARGDAAAALPYIEPIARTSRSPRVLRNYGVALDMLGRSAEAQAVYRRGLAETPADPDLHGNLALSLAASGDMAAAETEIRAAVNSPNAPERESINEVVLLAMAGRDAEARAAGTRLTDPGKAGALVEQGHRAAASEDPGARAAALGTIIAQASPGPP
jgi:alpha-1,2-mannosyltransferase